MIPILPILLSAVLVLLTLLVLWTGAHLAVVVLMCAWLVIVTLASVHEVSRR